MIVIELVIVRTGFSAHGQFEFYLTDDTPGRGTAMASFTEAFNVVVGRPAFPQQYRSTVMSAIVERFPSADFGMWLGQTALYMSQADRGMLDLLAERT